MDIQSWIKNQSKWLQVAAKGLLDSTLVDDAYISTLTELCKKEANNNFPKIDCELPANIFSQPQSTEIRLCEISNISGVNKLAPRKLLNFGVSNIVVIYGENGSGKSGYVRLLKHICGTRDCMRRELLPDVFSATVTPQRANVKFSKNGTLDEYDWTGQGSCHDLASVDIFDTSFGRVFRDEENEVSYEPPILSFFSSLIAICEKVATKLNIEQGQYKSSKPNFPNDLTNTLEAEWFNKVNKSTTNKAITEQCSFTEKDNGDFQSLIARLAEQSPVEKAKQLLQKKNYVDKLIKDIQRYFSLLSDKNCNIIINAKQNLMQKKSVAKAASTKLFNKSVLDEVGSDVWIELWESARKYSEEQAYKDKKFPVVDDDSVCVLCHHPLSTDSKNRLRSFETYVKGDTQKQVVEAEKELERLIDELPDIPNRRILQTEIDAAGIENEKIVTMLIETFKILQEHKSKLTNSKPKEKLEILTEMPALIKGMSIISKKYEKAAKQYSDDAIQGDREQLKKDLKSLEAKKWLFEQKVAIQNEVKHCLTLHGIQKAKKLTDTTTLSKKKDKLAESLITDTFVKRFNNELKELKASQIKVKLIKTKTSKGKVLHKLQLDGVPKNTLQDVLSEGENRIISIAAFLADVTGKDYLSPFVFDDPISSLDQKYEEAVVKRLCSLASNKQVIVFTHRLSLLGLIQDYAKKESIDPEIICIRDEIWGTGEPGDTPLFAKKPDKALNSLIGDRLSKAMKICNEEGKEFYEPHAKALCGDFRILLERMIEYELLADVVQRYRRAINTMGKIENLAKISKKDCVFLDDLMTKYSCYEHSQPDETPILIPEPDELGVDFNKLKDWHTEFKARPIE